MAVFSMTSTMTLIGSSWTGTAPGDPGTQTVSGTITSSSDISIMVTSVDISLAATELEYTNFASGGWKQIISGLKSGSVQINFNQDYAASQVDALFGLGGTYGLGASGTLYMDVKPTNSSRDSTNPSTVFQFKNLNYNPVAGTVGDLAVVSLTFPFTGQVARLTS